VSDEGNGGSQNQSEVLEESYTLANDETDLPWDIEVPAGPSLSALLPCCDTVTNLHGG
jgi:hypothetical protein